MNRRRGIKAKPARKSAGELQSGAGCQKNFTLCEGEEVFFLDIPFYRTTASTMQGPLREFYQARVAKGMQPALARLTLARKMAAIALILWKKGEVFEAKHLNSQAA